MSVSHTTVEKEEITEKEGIPEQGGLAEKEGISESRIDDVRREPPSLYEDGDEDFKFTIGKALACFSFIVGNFADVLILILGSSIVATINKDLGPNVNYTWAINAQVVSSAVLAPFVGRLSDIFGRRNFFLLGNMISLVENALAAKSTSLGMVIAGTTLIGSAAAMHQIGFAAISEVVPRKRRRLAQGLFQSSLAIGSATGPIIGYALIKFKTWRDAYWISFSLNGIDFFLVLFSYHPQNQYILEEGKTRWGQFKSLDYVGLFTFTGGLVLFLMGLSFGGVTYPWASAGTLAPILIGVALLFACGFWEAYLDSPYALFPKAIIRDVRGFTVVLGVVFLMGMLYYSSAVLWPLQVQILYATDPIIIGAYSGALGMGSIFFGPLFGLVFQRYARHGRWVFTSWVALVTITCGCQAIVSPMSNIASTVLICLTGILVAGATVASTSMAQLGVPHEFIGIASALLITARTVGVSVATTVYSVILQNYIKDKGAHSIATALAETGLPLPTVLDVLTALLAGDPTSPALASAAKTNPLAVFAGAIALKKAYSKAFRLVYFASIAFGVCGTICAAFSLNVAHLMTRHVDVTLDEGVHLKTIEGDRKGHIVPHHGEQ